MPRLTLFYRWLLACQLLMATSHASCPGFRLGTTSCNSGIFSKSSISASCASDGAIAVTGTVLAPNDFEDAEVTFVPCIRTTGICFDEYAQNGGTICDLIETKDGSECGTAGKYVIDQEFFVPDDVIKHSWAMRFVTVKVLVDNEEACTQNATTAASSEAFMASGMACMVAVVGLGSYFVKRRRPVIALENGLGDHGFIHMSELSPSVSSLGIRGAFTKDYYY